MRKLRLKRLLPLLVIGFLFFACSHQSFGQSKLKEAIAKIVLVEIDDSTFAALGRWPFKRGIQAEVIKRICEAESKVLLYQVLLMPAGESDKQLRQVLALSGPPVVFPLTSSTPKIFETSRVHYGGIYPMTDSDVIKNMQLETTADLTHIVVLTTSLATNKNLTEVMRKEIALSMAPQPFVRMRYQDILSTTPAELKTRINGKIIVVGVAGSGVFAHTAPGAKRPSDPEVYGLAIANLMAKVR